MGIFLYSHGGSGNHGCEAIVRGTAEILHDNKLFLYSNAKSEDEKYGLNEITDLVNSRNEYKKLDINRILASLQIRLFHNEYYATKISISHMLKKFGRGDIGISIGGDNYCYPGFEEFCVINKMIRKRGIKTVLWGCSVEPAMINSTMAADLLAYDLIVARESITYEAMKRIGAKAILTADPAFFMQPKECEIDARFFTDDVIGVNMSPLILQCASDENIAYKNYLELIKYIIKETNFTVALIPHVVWKSNDDRKVLQKLYNDIGQKQRIIIVKDHTAPELKYIISKCKMFIGARTHATIAAYSSFVPTLVVGYSVKARGIAIDLFGTEKNYVLEVQKLKEKNILMESFKWLNENKDEIHRHLKTIIPEYTSTIIQLKENIMSLL